MTMNKEVWYYDEEDVLGIQLSSETYWKSVELPNGILIDVAKDGKILGIEIFRAKKIFSGDVRKVIEFAKQAA